MNTMMRVTTYVYMLVNVYRTLTVSSMKCVLILKFLTTKKLTISTTIVRIIG